MTLAAAAQAYLDEIRQRELSESSQCGYRCLLRSLQAFADKRGLADLRQIDTDILRDWLAGRGLAASTRRTELARLKAFFKHTVAEGWVDQSPAARIRPPQAKDSPTLPLDRQDVLRLVAAAGKGSPERAMVLLLRWGGLAIRDAATLCREDLRANGELVLRRAKTGELVTVQLPDAVAAALRALPQRSGGFFFWTGESRPQTVARYWRSRLAGIAKRANVPDFHPHRLRDTFAVELLLADVSMEDVSALLGHSSVKTTERYYAPWNSARTSRLARIVKGAHRKDPVLRQLAPKEAGEAGTNSPPKGKLGEQAQANRVQLV